MIGKIPNSKHQKTNKHQNSSTKLQTLFGTWDLVIGIYLEFVICVLGFSLLSACGTVETGNSKSETLNPEKERIEKLVKDLDDNDKKVRENATEELIKIGEPALEDVKKALIKPPNNEVRIRATHIVSEIEFNAKKFKITFVSNRDGNNGIYTMDVDGSNQKRMTNNKARDEHP